MLFEFVLPSTDKQLVKKVKKSSARPAFRDLKYKYYTEPREELERATFGKIDPFKRKGEKTPKTNVLGTGVQSTVQSTGADKIVKNTQTLSDYLRDPSMYYLVYARKHWKDTPLFPRVHKIELVRSKEGKRAVARIFMEKLRSQSSITETEAKYLKSKFGYDRVTHDDFVDEMLFGRSPSSAVRAMGAVLRAMKKKYPKGNYDLHDANVMFRGRGKDIELVVTDPFYYGPAVP